MTTTFRVSVLDKSEWQEPVLDKDLVTPPLSPLSQKGDRYLIYGTGSGAWLGQDRNIAEYDGSGWIFVVKREGMLVYVKDEGYWYSCDGTLWSLKVSRTILSKTVEIDFGAIPVSEANFIVLDPDVKINSIVTGGVVCVAPTGKDLDELEMDAIDLKFGSRDGQLVIWAKGLEGYLADKFKVNYMIGV